MQKKTKIVATIGPASDGKEVLSDLHTAGLDVVRLNFSHGDHEEQGAKIDRWREMLETRGETGAVIADLAGPEVRTTNFSGSLQLSAGDTLTLSTKQTEGENQLQVNYENIPADVSSGDDILIDDGRILLEVTDVEEAAIETEVIRGGEISKDRRGVNVPSGLSLPALTEKDKKDVEFAVKKGADFIALSFVKSDDDVKELRKFLDDLGSDAEIISKIETKPAIENIANIVLETDALMVARGDLAVEIGAENVPMAQKDMIKKCNTKGVPVIVATQMLESMIESKTPTRAEVSDVANAILDGADAVMLSGETATGDNPVLAVKEMVKVAKKIENRRQNRPERGHQIDSSGPDFLVDAITSAAINISYDVDAKVLVALTDSGFTARMLARYKPAQDIVAFSQFDDTVQRLHASYGCRPFLMEEMPSLDAVIMAVKKRLKSLGCAAVGDTIVIASGLPAVNQKIGTNNIVVEKI